MSASAALVSRLLLVRPRHFGYNPENADNTFCQPGRSLDAGLALAEFEGVVTALNALGLPLLVLDDQSQSPDAVFPNNWFSLQDGQLFLYPLKAPSRRTEVRHDLPELLRQAGCELRDVIDWSALAEQGLYLEGTGSLVLDHAHRRAYAAISERTDASLVQRWADLTGYQTLCFAPQTFAGPDGVPHPIYHTNVLMAMGEGFALFCPAAVADPVAADEVMARLTADGHELVLLSLAQMQAFAGNMLQVRTPEGPCLLMSETARLSLTTAQLTLLRRHTRLAAMPIPTLEAIGGGSLRCMLGEIGYLATQSEASR